MTMERKLSAGDVFRNAVIVERQDVKAGDAFDGECPSCGHGFSLAELKRMAEGDGWRRMVAIRKPDGSRGYVSFAEFNPATMMAWAGADQAD